MNRGRKRKHFLKNKGLAVFVFAMILTLAVQSTDAAPIPGENDRIGWSADGNRHDPDDWGATAMALAIFAKQGWQNKLVHIDYNNWLPDNTPFKSAEETISVIEGTKKFKFTQTKLFDCQTDLEAAIDNVVAEINKSSSSSHFWYVQAGPFEVAYLALLKADPDKRKYCILVSHSSANDRPEHWPGQHGKDDCVALGAEFYYTTGQGKDKFGSGKFYEWQLVDWMKNSPSPEYRWIYSRLKKTAEHKHGVLDASDGGMAFALATGDLDGNFSPKLRDFLGTDWTEPTLGNPKVDPPNVPPSTKGASIEELGRLAASVEYDATIPQLAFAAQELNDALKEAGRENLQVTLIAKPDESSPEAFQIRSVGSNQVEVTGSDATGAMYGGLEVADLLRLGLPIEDRDRAPFVKKRGLKVNIPWDCRTPSYCDKGTAAQNNIVNVWDFDGFWKPYFDDLARYRYNVLSLWSTHAYPNLVKVPGYEDCALPDVYRVREELLHPKFDGKIRPDLDANKDGEVTPEDGTMTLVKKMTIDEKITHWKKVFQHAEDRGIEIYLFHWDIYVNSSEGKYGITPDQTNASTIAYVRASVKETLLTYPQIKGIGVTSGEDDRRELDGTPDSTENYFYKTYGLGIMDAQADPKWKDRDFRFIFRRHGTEYNWAKNAMKKYTGGILDTSVKYSVAHMYSSRRPQEWERRIVGEDWLNDFKAWLNLRNDDIFMHRFGSPDYVSEFIRNMPHQDIRGFYMGSDGYFWGREFISKEPEMAGQLEIDKHWYNFRMFGQMAYNNDLDDNYWKAVLKHRFPSVDADLLFNTWETVSEVIPQLNRAVWAATDGDFAPEMCQGDSFLSMDNYYFDRRPMVMRTPPPAGEEHCISVPQWADNIVAGKNANPDNKLTPLEVADKLDGYAQAALDALPTLEAQIGDNVELKETLLDIRSMAYLGRYYADKQRCAATLMVYRLGGRQDERWHKQAVKHIEDSRDHWKQYADVLESHYKTSLHAKTGWFRWYETLKQVEDEVQRVKGEGALPVLEFAGLADGDRFKAGDSLEVKVNATAPNGATEVKLYLNGLVLDGPIGSDPYVWNDSSDKLLRNLQKDWYSLEAVVVDGNGFVKRKEIYINVGNDSEDKEDWKFETYAVILSDGQDLTSGHGDTEDAMEEDQVKIQWDKLEAQFYFDSSGKLKLRDDFLGVNVFKSRSKADPGPRRCEFKDGSITTYNLIEPVSVLWSSRMWDADDQDFRNKSPVMDGYTGPFEFVVTRGKKVAITGIKDGKRQVVWYEDPDYEDWTGRFEAVAKDKTGNTGRRETQITVSDVSENSSTTSKDELHQVVLNEGERLVAEYVGKFPRLQCKLKLEENGKLLLRDDNIGKLFQSDSEGPDGYYYAALENGQLRIYRGTPDNPEGIHWETPKPSGPGPYKFGITVSKKLVIFREVEGEERKTVWMSN